MTRKLLISTGATFAVTAVFFFIGLWDRDGLYDQLLSEDGPVEWIGALLILATCVSVLGLSIRLFKPPRRDVLLACGLLLFAALLFIAFMEEISYGQRLFGWESSEFFVEHSDQSETNLHNVMQAYLKEIGSPVYLTRHFLAIGMGFYGLVLPGLLWLIGRQPKRGSVADMLVPPLYLASGFVLGCFFLWFDWPTGIEEELGETYMIVLILVMSIRAWSYRAVVPTQICQDSDQAVAA